MQDKIKAIVTEFLVSKGLEVPDDLFKTPEEAVMVEDYYLNGVELVLLHEGSSETYSALSLDGAYNYGQGYELYNEFCEVMESNGLTCEQIYGWCSGVYTHRDYNRDSMTEVQSLLESLADPDSDLYDDLGEVCGQAADALSSLKNIKDTLDKLR
jgi:hypothetical protein